MVHCQTIHFYLLAFGNCNPLGLLEQTHSIVALQFTAGRNGLGHFDISCFQKLGCFGAAGSAAAVVVPVDGLGHVLFLSVVIAWHSNLFCGVGEIGVY